MFKSFTVDEVAESELKQIRKEVELAQLICDLENEGDGTFLDLSRWKRTKISGENFTRWRQ